MRPTTPAPSLHRSWVVLPITALAASIAGLFVAMACSAVDVGFPVSALFSLAVLVVAAQRARLTLPRDPAHAFSLALGAASLAGLLFACLYAVHLGINWVQSEHIPLHHRKPGWYLVNFGLPAVMLAVVSVVVVEALARAFYRPLRTFARVAVAPLAVVVALVAAFGLVRAARLPPPVSPIAGLPDVASVRTPSVVGTVEDHPVGPVVLTIACVNPWTTFENCHVILRRSTRVALPPGWPADDHIPDGPTLESSCGLNDNVSVVHDARHDLWVVLREQNIGPHPFAAFRGPGLARVNVSLRDYPGEFAPARGWCLAALFGCALALVLARRGAWRVAGPPAHAADAMLDPAGTVHLAAGVTRSAIGDGDVVAGPCVVALADEAGTPYRDAAPVRVLRGGTLQQWRDALRAERDVGAALALSALALLGTPLVFAGWARLLW
jgi:hypothetical protein